MYRVHSYLDLPNKKNHVYITYMCIKFKHVNLITHIYVLRSRKHSNAKCLMHSQAYDMTSVWPTLPTLSNKDYSQISHQINSVIFCTIEVCHDFWDKIFHKNHMHDYLHNTIYVSVQIIQTIYVQSLMMKLTMVK